jgi:UTP--glucose-1-phosphate uridylyltransferase
MLKPKIIKAVIPVAGFATRFLPVAKAFSKALLPVVDKPVLQFLVEDAVSAGIEEIIFVVSPEQDDIQKYFSPSPALEEKLKAKGEEKLLVEIQEISTLAKFDFVVQTEMKGDGHAVLQAEELLGAEPFLVLFGDDLIFGNPSQQLIEIYEKENASVVGLQEVDKSEVENYGIVGVHDDFAIEQFIEKPKPENAPSNLAIVGKYVCTPRIFEILKENPNSSGEVRLIDALEILLKEEKVFGKILAGERFDCGSKSGWLKANLFYAKRQGLRIKD